MPRPALLAACLALSGCAITVGGSTSSLRVDGVELEEQHDETLEIGAWSPDGLELKAVHGDVLVERAGGPSRIHVTLHETEPGDARAEYRDGVLSVRTRSGRPAAIGEVVVLSDGPLPALHIDTSFGDVHVADVPVTGPCFVVTGMGDVELAAIGSPERVRVVSGMGDLTVADVDCGELHAESGMGDVDLIDVEAAEATLQSGMGDVEVRDSRLGEVVVETGLGDVDLRRTSYENGRFETGLGSVSRR